MPVTRSRRLFAIEREMGSKLRLNGSVARKLATLIITGRLREDETLPNEDDLSVLLEVSRTAYREGLRTLVAKGMLESRPRIGTRVAPRRQWNMLDPDVLTWHLEAEHSAHFVRSLFELRRIVEPAGVALAAERHDEADADQMRAALTALEAAEPGSQKGVEADLWFHRTLLAATHNEPLIATASVIESTMRWSVRLTLDAFPEAHGQSLPDHRLVLEAVLARDAESARAKMDALIADAFANLNDALNSMSRQHATAASDDR